MQLEKNTWSVRPKLEGLASQAENVGLSLGNKGLEPSAQAACNITLRLFNAEKEMW